VKDRTAATRSFWWESPWSVLLLALLAAVPLLYPPLPPLLDLPSHMGRYRIQLEHDTWATFREYYRFTWAPIGNLGIDLLVYPLAPILGLETAVKLIVLAIPPLTVAGFLLTAREIHGRIPPTALFALPLAYNFPLYYGFVNFSLAMALAFLAFLLWLRLGRTGRLRTRAFVFVPLSLLLWLCHTFGWAFLGVLAFAAEFVRHEGSMRNWHKPGWRAALACLPLAPPAVGLIAWRLARVTEGSVTNGWFFWQVKAGYLLQLLRDRWYGFDVASAAVLALVALYALDSRKLSFDRILAHAAAILLVCYVAMPSRIFGAAFADMRLLPYLCAVTLLAIRPLPEAGARFAKTLALAGLAFLLVRTGGTTASFALYSREFQRELGALPHIREGSRVVAIIGSPCRAQWTMRRLDHISGIAIVRRRAFTNDQWDVPGAQLVMPHYPAAGPFEHDSSQIVRLSNCPGFGDSQTLDQKLREVPYGAFDYLWLVEPPKYDPSVVATLHPVWRNGTSVLYRIDHPQPAGAR
jgi:hypothetical protein